MRRAGVAAPSPRVWSPSPAWPEGRGVFLLRPLLAHRRAELRALLRRSARPGSRIPPTMTRASPAPSPGARLAAGEGVASPSLSSRCRRRPGLAAVARASRASWRRRERWLAAPSDAARRALGAMALSAAGAARAPAAALAGPARRTAGRRRGPSPPAWPGARIEAAGEHGALLPRGRRARAARRRADTRCQLGETRRLGRPVRDRRAGDGPSASPLAGRPAARLAPEARRLLALVPAGARGALPAASSTGWRASPARSWHTIWRDRRRSLTLQRLGGASAPSVTRRRCGAWRNRPGVPKLEPATCPRATA